MTYTLTVCYDATMNPVSIIVGNFTGTTISGNNNCPYVLTN